jgi:hypothetical protein
VYPPLNVFNILALQQVCWLEGEVGTLVLFSPFLHLFSGVTAFPSPTRRPVRLVRNITLHPDDKCIGDPGKVITVPLLDESVWIFHLATRAAHVSPRNPCHSDRTRTVPTLLLRLQTCVTHEARAGTKVLIVGLDDIAQLNQEDLSRALAHLAAACHTLGQNADVELLSLNEYRKRVGPERATLETVMEV